MRLEGIRRRTAATFIPQDPLLPNICSLTGTTGVTVFSCSNPTFIRRYPVMHNRCATTPAELALEKTIAFRQISIPGPRVTRFQIRAHEHIIMVRNCEPEIREYVAMGTRRLKDRNAGWRLLGIQLPSPSVAVNISTERTCPTG